MKIPIGYIPGDEDDFDENADVAIFNHLDITVKTHNSFLTSEMKHPNATEFK